MQTYRVFGFRLFYGCSVHSDDDSHFQSYRFNRRWQNLSAFLKCDARKVPQRQIGFLPLIHRVLHLWLLLFVLYTQGIGQGWSEILWRAILSDSAQTNVHIKFLWQLHAFKPASCHDYLVLLLSIWLVLGGHISSEDLECAGEVYAVLLVGLCRELLHSVGDRMVVHLLYLLLPQADRKD